MKQGKICAYPDSLAGRVATAIHGRKRTRAGLYMTPMIDVIFLLLTFFVLTARFRRPEDFLPVKLPPAAASVVSKPVLIEPLVLEIKPDVQGYIACIAGIDEIVFDPDKPESGLAEMAVAIDRICRSQQRNAGDPIEIHCSDEVIWDSVVKIYDVLNAMGAENITFAVTQ